MGATRITLYGGIGTIGGVVAEISLGTDRVICEIGTGYSPDATIYDGIVQHRARSWAGDALMSGQAPPVHALYPGQQGLGETNTAVFVTHLHLDHMSAMGYVDNSIPVYLSERALDLERALQDIGQGVHPYHTNYHTFRAQEPIVVGEITVLPILIREDAYQDYSFVITTPDATIHYTGDLTLHGDGDHTWEEMELVAGMDIDIQIIDVTTLMDDTLKMIYGTTSPSIEASPDLPVGMLSAAQAFERYREVLPGHAGPAVLNIYEREITDIERFAQLAERSGRQLVLEPETGYVMWRFTGQAPVVYVPDFADLSEPARPTWVRELLASAREVPWHEMLAAPEKYLVQTTYARSTQLFDLIGTNALYVHDGGVPIGPFDPAFANLQRIIDKVGMRYVTTFQQRYFGHGYPNQVRYYAERIGADIVIPVHSKNPERFEMSGPSTVVILEQGMVYHVRRGHDHRARLERV